MAEKTINLSDNCRNFDVFSFVIVQLLLNTHSMESVGAGEHIKLTIKNWFETQVAHLARINGNMLVLLLSLLFSEHFGRLTVVLKFLLQRANLVVIVI